MCTHTSVNHNYVIFVALSVHLNKDLSSLVMGSRMKELLTTFQRLRNQIECGTLHMDSIKEINAFGDCFVQNLTKSNTLMNPRGK